jgi:hypothetical protein
MRSCRRGGVRIKALPTDFYSYQNEYLTDLVKHHR